MTDLFHHTPGNPEPDNASGGFLTASDGRRIRYACFGADTRPLMGTVIVLTGRNECIEKYFETIRDLTAKGFGVATLDWRGQGASDRFLKDGERGYVKSFDDYVADLDLLFEQVVLPDCRGPYYVLAHSAGATVALLAAPLLANRVRRMVLIAPFLELPGQPVSIRTVRWVTAVMCFFGLGRRYAAWGPRPKQTAPFETNKLTTDPDRYRRNTFIYESFPHLALGGPTVQWLHAGAVASQTIRRPEFIARIAIPTLIVAASADEVVSTRAVAEYAERMRLGSLLLIPGTRHEILQEADIYREQLMAAFFAFVPGTEDVS